MRTPKTVLAIALALAGAGAFAQTPSEASIKSQLALDGYRVTYEDASGKALSFDAFAKVAFSGQGFGITKDTATSTRVSPPWKSGLPTPPAMAERSQS